MTTIRVRILDEVSAVVLDLPDDHVEYFHDKYAVNAPNYFFNPRYKLGQWDGKIRFFHKTGKTFVYLLEDLLPRLVRLGYQIKLEDLRQSVVVTPSKIDNMLFNSIIHVLTGKATVLKPHQVEAVNALIEHGNGIALCSTGSGKTLMCAALAHQYGKHGIKTLTIVPNRDLISQTKDVYTHYGLDTGEYSGVKKTVDHQHVVSTWQALKNNPAVVAMFQMVIVDECHTIKGNVLSKILTDHASKIPYRFGFTGTLPKEKSDMWAVHVAVGQVRYEIAAAELIEKGDLAKPQIDIFQLEEDLTEQYQDFLNEMPVGLPNLDEPPTYAEFKDGYFPDHKSEKSYLQRKEDRVDWIAQCIEVRRDAKKGNVLCYVDSIALGKKLITKIPNAVFINGRDVKKTSDRKKIYDLFATENDLVVIATVQLAGAGLDIPRIFNLVMVDLGKSFIRVIQGIGRGLRIAEDKDSIRITDITSDLKISRKHTRERVKYYKDAKYPHKLHKVKYESLAFD
jgi:superfamily II DNA or RNA helicase